MHKPYVIAFAGPPRAGKDTIADELIKLIESESDIPIFRMTPATPLREMAAVIAGEKFLDDRIYRDEKDSIIDVLGISFRQLMIKISEEFLKPQFGQDVMGKLMTLDYLENNGGAVPALLVNTSLGFQEESEYVENNLAQNGGYLIVQIEREGCDFTGDSRTYPVVSKASSYQMRIQNDSTPEAAAQFILAHVRQNLRWQI